MNRLIAEDGLPDWDYSPWDREECPFEYKASDWGRYEGRLVALDYSVTALTTPEEWAEIEAGIDAWP